jgi:hypothetical protein
MRRSERIVSLVATAAVALMGCSAVEVASQPGEITGEVACPEEQIENGARVLACAEAVRAAERALDGLHSPILSAEFARGVGNCPKMPAGASLRIASADSAPGGPAVPSLRCTRISRNTSGTVLFTFWFGDPVRMYVALDREGVAIASSDFMDVEVEAVEPPVGPGNAEP